MACGYSQAVRTLTALLWLAAAGPAAASLDQQLAAAGDNAAELRGFIEAAATDHGKFGERAAVFLVEGIPASDLRALRRDFLLENLRLALQAREGFPWAKAVPDEVFLNDVLPYAVFDEPRDPWRADLHKACAPLVAGCTTASEAAQQLNRGLFPLLKVRYHTGRRRPNQSPRESIESGMASCTGLSILLVDACRAVGIPARGAGTPRWTNKAGNHTWAEVWDQGWHFTGAAEPDPQGLDRGWFAADAASASATAPEHAIYATTWAPGTGHFPLVWDPASRAVHALNVTERYTGAGDRPPAPPVLHVRVFAAAGGERLAVPVRLLAADGRELGHAVTKAGTADLNDMPALPLPLPPETRAFLRVEHAGETREAAVDPPAAGAATVDLTWPDLAPVPAAVAELERWLAAPPADRGTPPATALDRPAAERALAMLWSDTRARLAAERGAEIGARSITLGGLTMPWLEHTFGSAPAGRRSLFISMHGGGGAPPHVNDSQWHNQIRLYQPAEGIVVAPRAPTDTWNLWHQSHVDRFLDRLIEDFVVLRGADPDRVYLLGYSAGGDGVWQLAPRAADRFAAAAMMAGHPNEARLDGLRNLPFAAFVGADDTAYDRSRIVAERIASLGELRRADPGGYAHLGRVYPGLGHWMNLNDREALPWMAGFSRNPWPDKVVWLQDDVAHERFYWLEVPAAAATKDRRITAARDGQTVRLDGDVPPGIGLRLSDALLDLDLPLHVVVNGKPAFEGTVPRTAAAIAGSLALRADPRAAATAVARW